jgi:hypothetical protein
MPPAKASFGSDLYDGTLRAVLPLTRAPSETLRFGVYGILSEGPEWQKSVRHGKLRSGKYTTCALQKKTGAPLAERLRRNVHT